MRTAQKLKIGVRPVAVSLLSLLLLVLFSHTAPAQDDLDVLLLGINRNGKIPEPQGDFKTLTIPIKRAQNLLLIEARIDGVSGNFILDTGAPHLVLNKTYFRQGKLADGVSSNGITGGGAPVYHMEADSLIIQDLYYTRLDADLVNLGHLEDAKGVKILGLLGANLFSGMQMEIDLQKNVLRLTRVSDEDGQQCTSTDGTPTEQADLTVPVEMVNDIIFVNTTVEGKKLRFCLDTGAETNVLSNGVGNKVLNHFHLMSRTDLGGSTSSRLNVLSGQLDEIIIGNHSFKKMPVILTDLSGLQAVYNTTINGVLGYDFLSTGRVIINFKKKEISVYFYKEEGQ